jgi:drug/metabolite transporter (DMT)-like permease
VSLILAGEPIFAALFAWTLGGETFMLDRAVGGLLVVAAIMVAELPLRARRLAPAASHT